MVGLTVLATGAAVGAGSGNSDTRVEEHGEQSRDAKQREEEHRAYIRSDEGRDERARSRTAYNGQSPAEAHATARKKFPELIGPWPTQWPNLRGGERLKNFITQNSAIVETASGQDALIESLTPIRGEQPDGDIAPVDLALTDADGGEGFVPKSSAVRVRAPQTGDEQLRFPDAKFGIRLADARPATGLLTYGKAFYANALADTDLVVEGAAYGAEISLVLRSPNSPTAPELEFDLDPGQRLRLADGHAGGAEVMEDGERVAFVDPPTAIDAQGVRVPVRYSARGDRLAVKVDTDRDVAYPIMVDPVVYQDDRYGQPLPPSMGASWYWWNLRSTATPNSCMGAQNRVFWACAVGDATIWVEAHNAAYDPWDFAAWGNRARPGAYIFRFDVANLSQQGVTYDGWNAMPRWWNGIWDKNFSRWLPGNWTNNVGQGGGEAGYFSWDTNILSRYSWLCVHGPSPTNGACTPDGPSGDSSVLGNNAEFGLQFPNGGANWTSKPRLVVGGAAVYKVDQSAPRIDSIRHNPSVPDRWTEGYSASVDFTAYDNGSRGLGAGLQGLGPGRAEITRNGSVVDSEGTCGRNNTYETCSDWWTTPAMTYTAPEGKSDYSAKAFDIVDNTHGDEWRNWQVKIDTLKPTGLGLGEVLNTKRGQWVKEGKYKLSRLPEDAAGGSGIRTEQVLTRREGDYPSSDVERETFAPDTTGGWGSADRGGAWRIFHGTNADYSVTNGEGTIASNSGQEQLADLPATQVRNVDAKAQFRLPVSTGTTAGDIVFRRQMGAVGQRGNDQRRPYLRVGLRRLAGGQIYIGGVVKFSDGSTQPAFASHNTGLVQVGNEPFLMRAQLEGNQIRIRAWRPGTAEPTGTWMVNVTNDSMPQVAGTLGVQVFQTTGSRHTVGFDEIVVRELNDSWISQEWKDWDCGPDTDCQIKPDPTAPRVWEWDTADFREGQTDFKVEATDPLAYTGDANKFLRHSLSDTFGVKLDRTLPRIDSASGELVDTDRWIVPGRSYSVDVDTSDPQNQSANRSGVESIRLEVNGTVVDTAAGDPPPAGGSCNSTNGCHVDPGVKTLTWNVPADHDQSSNQVKIYAFDAATNKSTETIRTVKVDDDNPSASVISGSLRSARGKAVRGTGFGLHVEASDANPGSGVKQIQLFAGPSIGNLTQRLASTAQSCPAGNCTQTWDTTFSPTAADESRTPRRFRVRVEDQAGNGSDSPHADPTGISRWRLNETSGTQAGDMRGSNHGTYTPAGGYTLGEPGATPDGDRAVKLNGTSGYVAVPDAASLDVGDNLSIEAWFKRNSATGDQVILGKGQNAYLLWITGGKLTLRKSHVGNIVQATTTPGADGQWHHVVATKQGPTAKIYLDGVDVSGAVTNQTLANNAEPLHLGTNMPGDIEKWNGWLDEVAVYNRALSAGEVGELYRPSPWASRISRWRLNDRTSSTNVARDSKGANNGTYTGSHTLREPGATTDGDKAVRLTGGHVDLGNASNLKLANGTVEAWVKAPTPGSGYRGIVTKQWAYGLFLVDGVVSAYDWSTYTTHSTGVNIADGEWHHVALSFRSGVANGTTIYVDGRPRLTATTTVANQNTSLQVGNGGTGSGQVLSGTVDEASVYSSALGAGDVARLYGAQPDDWRIGEWRLNESSGTSAADSAPHPQLVPNPSFETDTSRWVTNDGAFLGPAPTLTREADSRAPEGGYVAKVVTPASQHSGIGTDFRVEAGRKYRVRVKVKRNAGGSGLRIALGERAAPNEELQVVGVAQPSSTGFTEYSATVTPSRSGLYRLYVRVADNPATATTFYVDGASVRESNTGTYTGGYTLAEPGATNDGDKAVKLNGTSGYVDLPNVTSAAGPFSVDAWVKLTALGGDQTIVSQRDGGGGTGRSLLYVNGATGTFASNLGGTARDSGFAPQAGRYYHVALTYTGGAGGTWAIYVDGVRRAIGTATGEASTGGWILGANKSFAATWNGAIDDAAVYPAALTPDEVTRLNSQHVYDWKVVFDNGLPVLDTPEPPSSSGWHNGTTPLTVKLNSYDAVSGVKLFQLFTPKVGGGDDVQTQAYNDCSVQIEDLCQTTRTHTFTYSTANMPDGRNQAVRAIAQDAVTNQSAQRSWDLNVDRTKPIVDDPGHNGRWVHPSQNYAVDVDTSDNLSGVKRIDFYVDDALVASRPGDNCTAAGCDVNPPAKTFNWTVPASGPNTHTVKAIAVDAADNPSLARTWTLRVDRQVPDVEVSGTLWDARDKSVRGMLFGLHVEASDGDGTSPESGVKRVRLLVGPKNGTPDERSASPEQPCPSGDCTITWDTSFIPRIDDESRTPRKVIVRVEDHAGRSYDLPWETIFDNETPDPAAPAYANRWHDENATVTPTVSATDAISGVSRLGLRVPRAGGGEDVFNQEIGCGNVLPPACDTSDSREFNHGVENAAEGATEVHGTAADAAGNEGSSDEPGTLKVDRTPPVLTRSGAASLDGVWLREEGPFNLTLAATDAYSGVKSTETVMHSPKITAADAFDRTRPTTWGPADRGGDWVETQGPRSDFAVDDTEGTMDVPQGATRTAMMQDADTDDISAKMSVRIPPAPAGSSGQSTASLIFRGQPDGKHFRAYVRRDAQGQWTAGAETESGDWVVEPEPLESPPAAGDQITLRLYTFIGTGSTHLQVRIKAWKTSDPEPVGWQGGFYPVQTRVAGAVGLSGSQSAEEKQTFRFDDLEVYDHGAEASRDRVERDCDESGCENHLTRSWDWPVADGRADDGMHKFRARAADPLGHATEQTWSVGLDRGGPALRLSGTLKDGEGEPLLTPSQQLHMVAEDGQASANATRRSGVRSLRVWVDRDEHAPASQPDQPEFEQEQACPQSSCAMVGDYTFIPAQHTAGEHILTVEATDWAGNVTRQIVRAVVPPNQTVAADRLGLENYFDYDSTETGAGTGLHVNLNNGNAVWHSVPMTAPGRGLSTVVNLTYNSQVRATDMPLPYDTAGRGFSLGISGLTRVNERLEVVGNVATLTDTDGTRHQFVSTDGMTYLPPPGVNLHLRRFALAPLNQPIVGEADKSWAITRPDGVTYFFDDRGWATSIEDRNGNEIRYGYEYRALTEDAPCVLPTAEAPAEVDSITQEVLCLKRLARVVDPGGRAFELDYHDDVLDGVLTSRVASITDHAGRVHRFEYTDNYLTTFRQAVGTGEEERSFSFEYEDLVDGESGPDRLLSQRKMKTVVDPRGSRTAVAYPARTVATTGPDVVSGRTVSSVQDRGDTQSARTEYHYAADDCPADRVCRVVNDSLGRDGRHELDTAGRLVERTDADVADDKDHEPKDAEVTSEFEWDEDNNIVRMTEALGTPDAATTLMAYNVNGLLVRRTDPRGKVTTLEYDNKPGNHISPVIGTDDARRVFVSDLDRLVNARGKVWDFDVDARGNQTKQTDPTGAYAETTYDDHGQVTAEVDFREGDDPVNRTTYADYHESGQPRQMVDARGNAPGGDAAAHRWFYCYDAAGNLTHATDPRGPNAETACDARSDFTTRLVYDDRDRLVEEHRPIDTGGAANRVGVRKSGYDDNDNPVSEEDAEQAVTTRTFTLMDQVEDEWAPEAAHVNPDAVDGDRLTDRARTHVDYDVEENTKSQVRPLGTRTGGTGDYQTDFDYDDLNRVLVQRRRSTQNVSEEATSLVTSFDYDRRGNIVGVSDPKHNAEAPADPAANAENIVRRRFTYGYDLADNRTKAIEAPGTGAGRLHLVTSFAYSPTNKLLFETDPRGNAGNGPAEGEAEDHRKEIRYDARDMVVDQIDQLGRRTHIERRGDGRVVSQTSPRGTRTEDDGDYQAKFEYYPTGELRKYTFPRVPDAEHDYLEQEFDVEYLQRDAIGSPTQIRDARDNLVENTFFDGGEVKTTNRAWWWRAEGDRVAERNPTELGKPEETEEMADEPAGGDYGGVSPQKPQPLVPRAGHAEFDYDDEMRLKTVEDADDKVTTLVRDAMGRVTLTKQPFGAPNASHIETESAYDHNGNVRQLTDGRDKVTTVTYDQYDRPVRRREPGSTNAFDTTEMHLDPNGKTVETHTPEGNVSHSTYDAADRLIRTEGPEDRNGAEITAYSYDAAGNMVERISPRAPRDAAGNLVDDGGDDCARGTATEGTDADCFKTKRTYTEANELETETDGHGNETESQYDPDGNLNVKVEPGSASSEAGEARRRTEYTFDARGLQWREVTGLSTGDTQDNANLRTTVSEFDGNGNQRREVAPAGMNEAETAPKHPDTNVARTSPDESAHRSSETIRYAAYNARVTEYDADNVLRSTLLPWGDADAGFDDLEADDKKRFRQDYEVDDRGFVTEVTELYRWVEENNAKGSPKQEKTEYTHFDNGWIQTVEEGPVRSGERQKSTYSYDAQGNQSKWTQTAPGTPNQPTPTRTVEREYYDSGLLKKRTAQGQGYGTTPGTRSYSYEYDRDGRPVEWTDADLHRRTEIEYDAAGRELLVDEEATDGSEPKWANDTLTTYDREGNVVARRTDGKSDGLDADDYTGGKRTLYEQDALGREVQTRVVRGSSDRYFVTDYYSSGQRKTRKRYDGSVGDDELRSTESYFFELDGRLERRERESHDEDEDDGNEQSSFHEYKYDSNGNRTQDDETIEDDGEPKREKNNSYHFNARDQVMKWVREKRRGTATTAKWTVRYTVNGSGEVNKKFASQDSGPEAGRTQETSYQTETGGQQLTGQTTTDTSSSGQVTNGATQFCNSPFGEMTSQRDVSGGQTGGGCPQPGQTQTDANERGATEYDAFGRVTKAIVRDQNAATTREVSYRYDGFDRRDFKCENGSTGSCTGGRRIEFSYVGLSERLSEQADTDSANTTKDRSFDYGADLEPLGFNSKNDGQTGDGDYRSYEVGPNGTVEGLAGDRGVVEEEESYEYDPYGKALTRDGSMGPRPGENPGDPAEDELSSIARDNPFRFQGHYYDSGVKSYDMQARQYMPEVGRFQSADRYEAAGADMNLVTDPLTQNRYAFAGGNPIGNVDWDGHEPVDSFYTDPRYCGNRCRGNPRSTPRQRRVQRKQARQMYREQQQYAAGYNQRVAERRERFGDAKPVFGGGRLPENVNLPKKGKIRIGLFIPKSTGGPIGMRASGDERTLPNGQPAFDEKFNANRTRATISIDLEERTWSVQINPTCAPGHERCKSALPLKGGQDNSISFKRTKDGGLRVDYNLKNSRLPKVPVFGAVGGKAFGSKVRLGPAINGNVQFKPDRSEPNGFRAEERGDAYPAREAYYHRPGGGPHNPQELYTRDYQFGGTNQLWPGPQGS